MKTTTMTSTEAPMSAMLQLKGLIIATLICALVFSVVIVRQQCIRMGYAISTTAEEVEQVSIRLQKLTRARAAIANRKTLLERASGMGLTPATVEDTWHVQ